MTGDMMTTVPMMMAVSVARTVPMTVMVAVARQAPGVGSAVQARARIRRLELGMVRAAMMSGRQRLRIERRRGQADGGGG
jgi:hypothetical protein